MKLHFVIVNFIIITILTKLYINNQINLMKYSEWLFLIFMLPFNREIRQILFELFIVNLQFIVIVGLFGITYYMLRM